MDKSEYDDIRDAVAERFDDARAETLLAILDHLYRPRESALDLAEAVCQLVSAEKRPDGSVVLHGLNSAARLIEANAPHLAEPGEDARELACAVYCAIDADIEATDAGKPSRELPYVSRAAVLIKSYVAAQVAKAREEERERCAERAVKALYDGPAGKDIFKAIRAAIKEAPDA